MICRTVLCTSKDGGPEDDKTNVTYTLCTPEVPLNGHEAVALEEEPQPIQELHTSPNQFRPGHIVSQSHKLTRPEHRPVSRS